jgi:ferritin-like metal-binding protein YciE
MICSGPGIALPSLHTTLEDHMTTTTLAELYVDKLKDLYSAEQQILKALPKMVRAARNPELQKAFETHRQQTETHVQRLDRIFQELAKSAHGKPCQGIKGIIEEGAELIKEEPEPHVLDVGLVAGAQSVEHYEMAGYGSARSWAEQLGYDEQRALLQQTLDEERQTDQLLTELAEQSINPGATVELGTDEGPADLPRRPAKRSATSKHTRPSAEGR